MTPNSVRERAGVKPELRGCVMGFELPSQCPAEARLVRWRGRRFECGILCHPAVARIKMMSIAAAAPCENRDRGRISKCDAARVGHQGRFLPRANWGAGDADAPYGAERHSKTGRNPPPIPIFARGRARNRQQGPHGGGWK